MESNKINVGPAEAPGALAGGLATERPAITTIQQQKVPTIEELANSWLYKEEAEIVLKYKDVVKRALINAVKRVRSYVLRYEYVYDEIYDLIKDEDEAWTVENAVYGVIRRDGVKIDDITVYKIYVDENESIDDVIVVLPGGELPERKLRMLEQITDLFATARYDRFDRDESRFYDATPIGKHERDEVYTVLHNLVCMWTDCEELEEEDEEEP